MTMMLSPTAVHTRFQTPPGVRTLRMLDVTIAIALIAIFLPVMLICVALIVAQDRQKAVFAHRRYGLRGKTFYCYKFRTMAVDADERLRKLLAENVQARLEWAADHKLRDDPRVTRLGYFMRKFSLDELPQLFNVVRGDMSLVGPRPIVASEVARYGHRFQSYCSLRPGITGIWQISGRNDVAYRRRVAMDAVYARRANVRLYVSILAGTAVSVMKGRGAY